MTLRGVFHALPPGVFGCRIRTRADLANFVRGTHAIAPTARLDLADTGDALHALCIRLDLGEALGVQPLTIPGTVDARYLPAYRLPALAGRIESIAPGELARALSRNAPTAPDTAVAADTGQLARQFLQLKRFLRDCATQRSDIVFARHDESDDAPAPV
ncbi:MAG: hypothetical protein DWQ11_11825 [Proteobacteria bacterium]|nr:MAG: hypothetical protein DWQ11_11825 [Pseudomonadota bacterium]